MDPRLRCAVDANVGWCEDVCTVHGVDSMLDDGLWSTRTAPPPLHPDAESVEPSVSAGQVIRRLAGRAHAGFKDSFAVLDLDGEGMGLAFEATWIYRAPGGDRPGMGPPGWTVVRTPERLASWTRGDDTSDVLLPGLLARGHLDVLVEEVGERVVAGAVARLAGGVVDVSNVRADPGYDVDWDRLAGAVWARFPGRPLVGYERGDDLAAARASGFVPVGDLRLWLR